MAVKLAPAGRKFNKNKQTRFEDIKRKRDKLVMQEGNDKMTDLMTNQLIYQRMYESDRAWKTVAAVRKGLRDIKYNKDKMAGLRDNIQMNYLSMGRADAQTNWSENRKQKTIPRLIDRLIEIIKIFKNVPVSDDPNTTMPQIKQQPVVGTLTHKVRQLNREREEKSEEFNMGCQKYWEQRDVSGEAATGQNLQALGKQKLDKRWIEKRIT